MRLTLAFVMDPVERVNVATDTTFAFMLEAQKREHRVIYVPPNGVGLQHDEVWLTGRQVELQNVAGTPVKKSSEIKIKARDCHTVFIRTDPPFDQNYLTVTWLLSFAERQGVWVLNSPSGVRSANEKLYALQFPQLCPETVVASARKDLLAFADGLSGDCIFKPIDGYGGYGVFRVSKNDSNRRAIIDHLTHEGRVPIIAQRFLPEVKKGDKRLLLIDGELRGVLRRVPAAGEHRGNVHVGGRAEACDVSSSDRAIAAALGPKLRTDGLFFVGLDVIGDRLIEVNVTSPTLVQELRRLGGPDLAVEVLDAVEARLGRPKQPVGRMTPPAKTSGKTAQKKVTKNAR